MNINSSDFVSERGFIQTMDGVKKVIKFLQFIAIGVFVIVFGLSVVQILAEVDIIDYDFMYSGIAVSVLAYAFLLVVKLVISVLEKMQRSAAEVNEISEGSLFERENPYVPSEKIPIPPTPDDEFAEPLYSYDNDDGEDDVFLPDSDDRIDSISELAEMLENYAKENGCDIKPQVFTAVLSAMACSHLIFVKGADSKTVSGLISVINNALGSSGTSSNGFGGGDVLNIESASYDVLKSMDSKNIIHLHKISAGSWESVTSNCGHLISCLPTVYDYFDKTAKNIRGNGKTILNNLFFICPIEGDMDVYQMPREIANASCVIEISPSDVTVGTLGSAVSASGKQRIDGNLFSELVRTACSELGISLGLWKKFDKVQAILEKNGKAIFGNIQLRQIERFASVYMSLGVNETEAFDRAIACKVIPTVSKEIKETIGSETVISDSVESIFGADALPITQNEIVKLSAAFIQNGN